MAGSANSAAKPTATHPSTSALITAWHPGEAARRMNMIIVIVITILLLYILLLYCYHHQLVDEGKSRAPAYLFWCARRAELGKTKSVNKNEAVV